MVELFKTLGDLNRLRLVNLLNGRSICVCEMEVILEMTQSNVSRHLTKLKSVHALDSDKDAQWVHYSVSGQFIKAHSPLFQYLEGAFQKNDIFRKDLERWETYKSKGLTCQHITSDRDMVLTELTVRYKEEKNG